jgi:hypothetical protein
MSKGMKNFDLIGWLFDFIGIGELPCQYQVAIAASLLVAALIQVVIRFLRQRPPEPSFTKVLRYLGYLAYLMFFMIHLWHTTFHCQTCIEYYLVLMDKNYNIPAMDVTIEMKESGKDVYESLKSDQKGGANLCIMGTVKRGEVVLYQSIYGDTVIPFNVHWWQPDLPDTVWLKSREVTIPLRFVDIDGFLTITTPLQVQFGSPSNGYHILSQSNDGHWYAKLSNDSIFEIEVVSAEYESKLEVVSILHPDGEPLIIPLQKMYR